MWWVVNSKKKGLKSTTDKMIFFIIQNDVIWPNRTFTKSVNTVTLKVTDKELRAHLLGLLLITFMDYWLLLLCLFKQHSCCSVYN